jgi:hypothetical protein
METLEIGSRVGGWVTGTGTEYEISDEKSLSCPRLSVAVAAK